MLRGHHSFFLPTLTYLTNGNTWLGSFLGLRFRIQPSEDGGTLDCLTWYGENCLELSEIVHTAAFPLTAEGREQVIDWLEEEYAIMPPERKIRAVDKSDEI